jgi:hypothetical protein
MFDESPSVDDDSTSSSSPGKKREIQDWIDIAIN